MGKKKGCGHRGSKEGRKKSRAKHWTTDLKAHKKTKRRKRDIDQIQDEIKAASVKGPMKFEIDESLPGLGQFYCMETGRHFTDANALAEHKKTRAYKRRLKDLAQPQMNQDVADWGAGRTKEVLPPAHAVEEENKMSDKA